MSSLLVNEGRDKKPSLDVYPIDAMWQRRFPNNILEGT
jgi:hypothetical protein